MGESWRDQLNAFHEKREAALWASGDVTGPRIEVFHRSIQERKAMVAKMSRNECRLELERLQAQEARRKAALASGMTELQWLRAEFEAVRARRLDA